MRARVVYTAPISIPKPLEEMDLMELLRLWTRCVTSTCIMSSNGGPFITAVPSNAGELLVDIRATTRMRIKFIRAWIREHPDEVKEIERRHNIC